MPTYEYRCAKCGEHLEVFQSFSEAPLTRHQACGGKLHKVLSAAGVILKGSGFYKTDNRSSGGSKKGDGSSSDSGSSSKETSPSKESGSSKDSGSSGSSGGGSAAKPAAKSA
jgi:putative FmdB family regulatory protein